MMKEKLCPLCKNIKEGDKPVQPSGFYFTLEGDGVCGDEVLFGTKVNLVFHIPELLISEEDEFSLGFSVIPIGLRYPDKNSMKWYKTVELPCKETELVFSFVTPTEEEWKKSVHPGFVFTLDMVGLIVFNNFLSVKFSDSISSPQMFCKKFELDLEKKIDGMVARVKKFHETIERER